MVAMRKSLLFGFALAAFVAVALAHFEDGTGEEPAGAVPAPGSETTVGDPEADPGFEGPQPGSEAEAAEAAAAAEGGDGDGAGEGAGEGEGEGDGADAGAADGGDGEGDAAAEGDGDGDGSDAAAGAAAAGASGSGDDDEAATTGADAGAVETPEPGTADPSAAASDDEAAGDDDATPEPSASDEDDDDASGRSGDATDEDDGSVCFPGSATVLLDSGRTKTMEELTVGDRVHVGRGQYSDVFMFTHKLADVINKFVAIETVSGAALRLTASHYMYVNGELQAAKAISVGDVVELANGERDTVSSVASVVDTGLYNPQTVHGDVVVNGVLASTYTTTVEPAFAHAVLSPFRAAYNALGFATTSLESGSSLDVVLPSGAATSVV